VQINRNTKKETGVFAETPFYSAKRGISPITGISPTGEFFAVLRAYHS
jgi:hypothetical protein